MTLASLAAAGLVGVGVAAAAMTGAPSTSQEFAGEPQADLAAVIAAAMDDEVEASGQQSEAPGETPSLLPSPTQAGFTTIDLSSAIDNVLPPTDEPADAAVNTVGAWLAPLRTNWDAINRAAQENVTVNAFNAVLPAYEEAVVVVRSGDTMMNLLTDMGIDRREAYNAIESFGEVFDPRRLRVGHEFNVAYEPASADDAELSDEERIRLLNISLRTAPDQEVLVRWDEEAAHYVSEARAIDLEERFMRAEGTINSSLYMAANELGVPDAMTIGMIRIFSHSVDFQRDIREGDGFEVYYSQRFDESGEAVMNGDIVFASMTTRGQTQNLYRFTTPDDGLTDYFDEDGQSVRSFLMRTPIDGARISSNFGPRRHPVLGYNRMHRGTDFAAPTGTPIYAAGNGTIVRASRFGSYGNYVRIRHPNGFETAYAHLNGYGPGIRSGVRVEQGQVIGYVGATGRVTGAHLHYEVLVNGEQVNPRTIDLPSGRELEGEILEAFLEHRAAIDEQMAAAPSLAITTTASAGGSAPSDANPDLGNE